MNCHEVRTRMNLYLDGELSPSEKTLVQAHLATCPSCQQQYAAREQLHDRLRRQLKAQAAGVEPSPQAWARVQAALPAALPAARPVQPARKRLSLPLFGRLTWQKAALALLVVLALFAVIPSVSARMISWVGSWFSFSSPDGENFAAIGGFTAFTPYHATYLPEGFENSGIGTASGWPDYAAVELTYDRQGGQFFTLLESIGGQPQDRPVGEAVRVGGNPAVYVPAFATGLDELVEKKPGLSIVTEFDYRQTSLLAWDLGELRIEMYSNLPREEMIKIGESLAPMQSGEGEMPLAP